jgi:hypothetical protein
MATMACRPNLEGAMSPGELPVISNLFQGIHNLKSRCMDQGQVTQALLT